MNPARYEEVSARHTPYAWIISVIFFIDKQAYTAVMNLPKIENLELVGGREFPPRTPHTYAHTGEQVLRRFQLLPTQAPQEPLGSNVRSLFPDLPEATIYYFPGRES